MGSTKETGSSTQVINQTTTPTPTAEETAMNKLMVEQQQAISGPQTESMLSGFNLINQLLTGGELPGNLQNIPQGIQNVGQLGQTPNVNWTNIDPNMGVIGEDYTNQLVQQSLRDIMPQFQSGGILDSGVAASIAGRTAGDIRLNTAQSNLERQLAIMDANRLGQVAVDESNINRQLGASQFDIGQQYSQQAFNAQQLLNLLNLTIGAPAQIQQPVLAQNQMLSNNLAGLRSINTSGTSTTNTVQSSNPFLTSFYSGLGGSLGKGIGSGITSGLPGFGSGGMFGG
jgi:hypothetical protein